MKLAETSIHNLKGLRSEFFESPSFGCIVVENNGCRSSYFKQLFMS